MALQTEPLLTVEEVAKLYKRSPRTVEGWIQRGVGPKSTTLPGGDRVFTLAAVKADLESRGIKLTDAA